MTKYVYCRTRFIGFHCWPDAPKELSYLSELHRHEFHVEVAVKVTHDNRDVEFQTLRHHVDECINTLKTCITVQPNFLDGTTEDEYVEDYAMSCEMMAEWIKNGITHLHGYKVHYVDVSEDGENGARIVY